MDNFTIWFTGFSGSGKSTLANKLKNDYSEFVYLDGDILRKGISSDLGFSEKDRTENNRRLIEICKLFNSNGKNVVTTFISPFEKIREKAKREINNCYIIWCNSSLEKCEERDVKGLYKKVREGKIKEFTGITSPYDFPQIYDLKINTEKSIEESYLQLYEFISNIQKEKIICIDFDGVIAEYDGYKGWGVFGNPILNVDIYTKKLKEDGWKIIIFTTRNETKLIEEYCYKHNIAFDTINKPISNYIHTNNGKPHANIYLDDRAITFNGYWKTAFEKIINFKTWSGRE